MKRIRGKTGRKPESEIPVIVAILKVLYDNDMMDAIDKPAKKQYSQNCFFVHVFILEVLENW